MTRHKLLIVIFVSLAIGFGGGFFFRPIIMPPMERTTIGNALPTMSTPDASRSVQYFELNIGEARKVVAACRDGSARGDECANAETAIVTVESRERFKRFRNDR